jgi:sulfate transport system substrate-binding protein
MGPRAPAPHGRPHQFTLTVGAFASAREAYGVRILPQFAYRWRRLHHHGLSFHERYESSGELATAIATGFDADVAVFSHVEDLKRLVALGAIDPDWQDAPHQGVVSRTLVVLAVRRGNPLGISDWRDLARPGLRIVAADPDTSGCGRWSICALYGAALRGHAGATPGNPRAAQAFVTGVLVNVVDRRSSANESFRAFQDGIGDVAITYESELESAWMFGHDEERVVPRSTLLVDHLAAVVDRNADRHGRRAAAELLQYFWSEEAQRSLAYCGLRPVHAGVAADNAARFPQPEDLWTIADLGGWDQAMREIVAPVRGIVPAAPGK